MFFPSALSLLAVLFSERSSFSFFFFFRFLCCIVSLIFSLLCVRFLFLLLAL